MLARWSRAIGATAVAASAATFGLLVTSPAHALEGIQGRHAIFYPSLELVYQHDDNFFLASDNEVSADTFIAHAHFVIEVPGARQFLRMEYAPQWRDVNVSKSEFRRAYPGVGEYDLDDNVSHFWNLDALLKGSSVFGVDIHQDFTAGVFETYDLDPGREFVNAAKEPFSRHDIGVDFKWNGSRQGAKVGLGKEDTAFDDVEEAPSWFELDAWRFNAEYHYKFAPLSHFVVGYRFDNATQDYTGKLGQDLLNDPTVNTNSLDSDRNSLWFGFDGELGRTTTGRATVGFASLDYDAPGNADQDYEGIIARADVTKSFSRWSKLIFNAERQPYYSGFSTIGPLDFNTYYVGNRASFTFTNQPQGGKVMWTLIGQFQRNDYDTPTVQPGGAVDREDDIARVRAEIGFHPLEHLSFRLNYQWEERESNILLRDYEDNLVMFQVQFGF